MSNIVVFVVAVAVLAVTVKSEDHRCKFTETRVHNCTRKFVTQCPPGESNSNSNSDTDSDSDSNSNSDSSSQELEEQTSHSRKRRSLDDFVANFLRRWFNDGDDEVDDNWCTYEKTFQCIMYRCYIGCCPGWKWDNVTDTCSIPDTDKPGIECLNGGTPVRGPEGWRCECPLHYTGSRCGETLCKFQCMNNGMCDMVSGRPGCVCPDNFNGTRCQTPVCEGGCNGNGRCVVQNGRPRCRCEHEYRGRNCEHLIPKQVKKGDCPPITPSTLGTCAETCETDQGCPSNLKCCYNGCGHMCMHPANYTCFHQGTNYKIGDVFYPDKCHVCTCLNPDPSKEFGGAQCRKPICPPIENCQLVEEDPDTCCNYCADPVVPDDEYEEPRFKNCPSSIVTIDVAHDRNEARLPFTLVAVDYKNKELKVDITRSLFRGGIGEENFDTVIATSHRDSMGKYAYCEFHVRIRDVHAPNFTFCPTDVLLTEEGKAKWEEPRAVDNVGLVRHPTANYRSGDHFRRGEHPVVYTVEDYEGNIARCQFFVKVAYHDASRMDHHHGHHKRHHIMYIAIGVAVFLSLVVLFVAAYLFRRCRKVRREAPANPPAYDNNIYNIGAPIPPPYKEKPPVYVSETDNIPEKKVDDVEEKGDEMKVPLDVADVDFKMGVDNPTYRL